MPTIGMMHGLRRLTRAAIPGKTALGAVLMVAGLAQPAAAATLVVTNVWLFVV